MGIFGCVFAGRQDRPVGKWGQHGEALGSATGREIRKLEGHSGWVYSVAFSPDGKTALSGSDDGTMRLWKMQSGQELATLIASPNGEYITITPSEFFAAPPKAVDRLAVVRGFETYSVLQFYEHLHRPDLVAERLKGDPEGKI